MSERFIIADAIEGLRQLPDESVHCVVTSPPYWGLRDYGTGTWDGGDPDCQHSVGGPVADSKAPGAIVAGVRPGVDASTCKRCGALRIDEQIGLERTPEQYVSKMLAVFREVHRVLRWDGSLWLNLGDCHATGAGSVGECPGGGAQGERWKGFRGNRPQDPKHSKAHRDGIGPLTQPNRMPIHGLKPKDLIGIPWRMAWALQGFATVPFRSFSEWADDLGAARAAQDWEAVAVIEMKLRAMDLLAALQRQHWYLRMDVIWAKDAPMPESVQDRPTRAHEMVFLLTKSERYFYDAFAIRESDSGNDHARSILRGQRSQEPTGGLMSPHAGIRTALGRNGAGRNKRSVWWINPEPFKGAHYAVMPTALVIPCVLAGTSQRGACSRCGAPLARVTVRPQPPPDLRRRGHGAKMDFHSRQTGGGQEIQAFYDANPPRTVGWRPTCACDMPAGCKPDDLEIIGSPLGNRQEDDPSLQIGRAGYARPRSENEGTRPITRYEQRMYAQQLRTSPFRRTMAREAGDAFAHYLRVDRSGARPIPAALLESWIDRGFLTRVAVPEPDLSGAVPCVVLDPFFGSGTTAVVARKLGRDFIGIDLDPRNEALALERLAGVSQAIPGLD